MPRSLARAQLLRAVSGRDCRCFETPAEAEAWLIAADDVEAALPPRRFATG